MDSSSQKQAQTIAVLLEELRQGEVVLLRATAPEQLSIGALAAEALIHAVGGSCGPLHTGVPLICFTRLFVPASFTTAVCGWDGVADLYEQLLTAAQNRTISHVVCLDRWSAEIINKPRTLMPNAKWLLLDHFAELKALEPDVAWPDTEAWVRAKEFDLVIPARELLEFHPSLQSTLKAESSSILHRHLAENQQAGRLAVIEESSDHAPNLERLRAATERWHDRQLLVLTPHLSTYRQAKSDWDVSKCNIVDTQNLALPTYQAILQCADSYLALGDWSFGSLSQRALRKDVEIQTVFDSFPDSAGRTLSSQAPAQGENASAPASTFGNWWTKHQTLMPAQQHEMDFSVLTFCYKYLQRFRIFLDSIARQDYPQERIEVCIVVPGNPDGIVEYLQLFQLSHPRLRVRIEQVEDTQFRNRGKMINTAFHLSKGRVVMVADGDIVMPPDFVSSMLREHDEKAVVGCWRTALSREITAQVITGNLDAVEHHEKLKDQWDDAQRDEVRQGVLGYCQIVSKEAFAAVRYPEEFDCINQSDIVFVERLGERLDIRPKMMKEIFLLHLCHQRNWQGTEVFL